MLQLLHAYDERLKAVGVDVSDPVGLARLAYDGAATTRPLTCVEEAGHFGCVCSRSNGNLNLLFIVCSKFSFRA